MKRILVLLLAVSAFAVLNAQNLASEKDPFAKTFITNTHAIPDLLLQQSLRSKPAWKAFQAAHGSWWVDFNETTGMPHRAFGKPIPTAGATPEERVVNFMQNNLQELLPRDATLVLRSSNTSPKYHYVTYKQQYNGLDVLWANATFRLSPDGNMIMFGLDVYPGIDVNTVPELSRDAAEAAATSGITIPVTSTESEEALKILPLPGEHGLHYALVYEVYVHTMNEENIPGNYYTLVDANTGEVYYRQNRVHECGKEFFDADANINSDISHNPLNPTENLGLGYIRVTIDGNYYYADSAGNLSLDFIDSPTPATIDLRGLYARVSQGTGSTNIQSVNVTLVPGTNNIAFDDVSGALTSEVSAYYHQNIVHDYMKAHWPTFNVLDVDQLIRVERTDGSCNAYYDGSSTNFFAAGGGCLSTALFNDVVMHEYGHGINYNLYEWLGGAMNNGSLQEGYADTWALVNTQYPILGQGFFGTSDSWVRNYDGSDPRVFPDDLDGEVHDNGEIIAGCWWDTGNNLGSVDSMGELWNETHYATEDGPDGSEGAIYTNILLDALVADDDNADLTDGTPHYSEITEAFCAHGISLLGNVGIDYAEPTAAETPDEPIDITTTFTVDYPAYFGNVDLFYRTDNTSPYTSMVMDNVSGTTFHAEIPAQSMGTIISYYFTVDNGCDAQVCFPKNANLASEPNLPYFLLVGYSLNHLEDFDNTFGDWEIDPLGTDDASTGVWDISYPIASFDGSYPVQTGTDHTDGSSNVCAVTGNAFAGDDVGTNDVDGGVTSLRSPYFDVTGMTDPVFTYWRWYSNDCPTSANPGNDVWQVRITNNGTDWVTVERLHTSDNSWRRNAIHIADYVEPTDHVGLLFIAQDSIIPGGYLEGGSLVEAGVDDLALYDAAAPDTSGNSTQIAEDHLIAGMYPNPVTGMLHIYFGNVSGMVQVTLYNSVGQMVKSESTAAEPGSASYDLDCSGLPAGVYTVSVRNAEASANRQVVISR